MAWMRIAANRGTFVRAVGVLCVALVCVMGTIQAAHSHPENSTTSHHTCTICATAHVVKTQTVAFARFWLLPLLRSLFRSFPDRPSRHHPIHSSSTCVLILRSIEHVPRIQRPATFDLQSDRTRLRTRYWRNSCIYFVRAGWPGLLWPLPWC